jgi:hypothetical protein
VGRLIDFGGRVRSGLSGLQDNQIISNKLNHKHKQNCQKFDTKTQSQTQQTQAQTQTHFLSRFGEISLDSARSHQMRSHQIRQPQYKKSPDLATTVEENNPIRLGMLASSHGVDFVLSHCLAFAFLPQ